MFGLPQIFQPFALQPPPHVIKGNQLADNPMVYRVDPNSFAPVGEAVHLATIADRANTWVTLADRNTPEYHPRGFPFGVQPPFPQIPLSIMLPNNDDGAGDGYLSQIEITDDLRYKFLDKWIYKIPKIMKRLKMSGAGDRVTVVSKKDAHSNNDDDSEKALMKKSDFVADEILTRKKARKILHALVQVNGLRFFELPFNEHYVKKAFRKYVVAKLNDMAESD